MKSTVQRCFTRQNDAADVRIEIAADKLLALLCEGRLCAADLRCLDCDSKRCLVGLVLKACATNLGGKPTAVCDNGMTPRPYPFFPESA